ncbi:PREDICTED: F-box/kelch-repeat protein At3g13680-like [Camelina sativa]|uniref:F-box/kelch-repeat protein At3g13680-like n=1 Tax=Camelina sativa TaxID=90675 RepID=A0ABM0ZBN8_CAMSA|nr:PREDICTED: F-box/kelch-repeat protein At3g13680-like [Camelina sativa]
MTSTMLDVPEDLVEEILSRVPMTSLRSVRLSCKKWNALSKKRIVGKAATSQFLGFMTRDSRVCSLRLDLQGIRNDEGGDLGGYPSIKQVSLLNHIEVSQTFHCDGLLLCILKDYSRLLVWNPYLGDTSWIQPRNDFDQYDWFALGYDKSRNHKILRIFDYYRCGELVSGSEIYEFSSKSWRVLDVTPDWEIRSLTDDRHGQSLNGNAYFCAEEKIIMQRGVAETGEFLLCFDFTSERFGPRLSLPFYSSDGEALSISCVRDEQLAVLHERWDIMEIWVTNKIHHGQVSWSNFLEVDMTNVFTGRFLLHPCLRSFFIDEEERVAVVFDLVGDISTGNFCYQTAHIIGQDGYIKPVNTERVQIHPVLPLECSSYVPSLVKID